MRQNLNVGRDGGMFRAALGRNFDNNARNVALCDNNDRGTARAV
jgi:hypothetical protein